MGGEWDEEICCSPVVSEGLKDPVRYLKSGSVIKHLEKHKKHMKSALQNES